MSVFVHSGADVSPDAVIGDGTRIWHGSHVREGAVLGVDCTVGEGVYVDAGVRIGASCKIQNGALVYRGVTLEDGVFVGPHVCFTNDRHPRAVSPEGRKLGAEDWNVVPTLVRHGASIGAGAVVVAGVTIGRFAMVAAGAVVTRDVPDHGLVMGVPARPAGFVCACGARLAVVPAPDAGRRLCAACGRLWPPAIGRRAGRSGAGRTVKPVPAPTASRGVRPRPARPPSAARARK